MIRFENVYKAYWLRGDRKIVADHVSAVFPSGKSVALLGRNGAGKSSLLSMIAGTSAPDYGRIITKGTVSWPVGFAGSFHAELTGVQNTRFVARVYGVDTDSLVDFVADFAELGKHFNMPLRTYSSGMKSRLAFGVSMGIKFDTYLVDEVISVGDAAFKKKSNDVFQARRKSSGAIVVSHSLPMIRKMCSVGAVLENGKLTYYDDLEEAIALHNHNMR